MNIGTSIVGGFLIAILTFVLSSIIQSMHHERLRVDEILRKQARVEATLVIHIGDHENE